MIPAQEQPYKTRDIRVRSATEEGEVGYGYVVFTSRPDWREIAGYGDEQNVYITETVAHYPKEDDGELIGIHFDASEIAEVFLRIAKLDVESIGEILPLPRIDTQPYEAYDGAEETVQIAYYQRGTRQFLLEYYDSCATTYHIRLLERDHSEWDEVRVYDFSIDDVRGVMYHRLDGTPYGSVVSHVDPEADDEDLESWIGDVAQATYGRWTDNFDQCLRELGVARTSNALTSRV